MKVKTKTKTIALAAALSMAGCKTSNSRLAGVVFEGPTDKSTLTNKIEVENGYLVACTKTLTTGFYLVVYKDGKELMKTKVSAIISNYQADPHHKTPKIELMPEYGCYHKTDDGKILAAIEPESEVANLKEILKFTALLGSGRDEDRQMLRIGRLNLDRREFEAHLGPIYPARAGLNKFYFYSHNSAPNILLVGDAQGRTYVFDDSVGVDPKYLAVPPASIYIHRNVVGRSTEAPSEYLLADGWSPSKYGTGWYVAVTPEPQIYEPKEFAAGFLHVDIKTRTTLFERLTSGKDIFGNIESQDLGIKVFDKNHYVAIDPCWSRGRVTATPTFGTGKTTICDGRILIYSLKNRNQIYKREGVAPDNVATISSHRMTCKDAWGPEDRVFFDPIKPYFYVITEWPVPQVSVYQSNSSSAAIKSYEIGQHREAVLGRDGLLYIQMANGKEVVRDPFTGSILNRTVEWTYPVHGPEPTSH